MTPSFLLYRKDLVTLKYKRIDSYRAKKRSAKDAHSRGRRHVAYATALGARISQARFFFAGLEGKIK